MKAILVFILSIVGVLVLAQTRLSDQDTSQTKTMNTQYISAEKMYIGLNRYCIDRSLIHNTKVEKVVNSIFDNLEYGDIAHSRQIPYAHEGVFSAIWLLDGKQLYLCRIYTPSNAVNDSLAISASDSAFAAVEKVSGEERVPCNKLYSIEKDPLLLQVCSKGAVKASWINGEFYVKQLSVKQQDDMSNDYWNHQSKSKLYEKWLSLPWLCLTFKDGVLIDSKNVASIP